MKAYIDKVKYLLLVRSFARNDVFTSFEHQFANESGEVERLEDVHGQVGIAFVIPELLKAANDG